MSEGSRALAGMARFRCIAEHCEDTCCRGLTVPLGSGDIARLESALRRPEAPPVPSDWIVPASGDTPAFLRPAPGGGCSALDERGLCGIHRRLGADALPTICARFPRVTSRVADCVELTGSLACPEVIRECVLAADGIDWVDVPDEPVGPAALSSEWAAQRETALALLRQGGWPLADRQILIAAWGLALESGNPRMSFDEPNLQHAVVSEARGYSIDPLPSLKALTSALLERAAAPPSPRFARFLSALGARDEDAGAWLSERRAGLLQKFGARLHALEARLATFLLLRRPADVPWLTTVVDLSARLALHRVALAAHPDAATGSLEIIATEAIQLTAKHVETSMAFTRFVFGAIGVPAPERFARLLVFSRTLE